MDIIRLTVNGKSVEISGPTTVKNFLLEKGINPNVVACELNLTILKRANLESTVLKDGDQLEVIQMIGGG